MVVQGVVLPMKTSETINTTDLESVLLNITVDNKTDNEYYLDTSLYTIYIPIVFAIIVIFGILGNLLVCYVILSRKKLRTITNLLLLNLSIADISFLFVCGTFTALHHALTAWPFGDILCRITQYLLYVTCYVTMYTLVSVSLARCVTIVYGPHSYILRSPKKVIIIIISIWITFILTKIPILVVHGVSQNTHTGRLECIISGRREAKNLFASFFVFAYALPLFFICTLYISAVCHLKGQKMVPQPDGTTTRRCDLRTTHVTKVVIVVVLVFAICWLPLHIHLLVAYYGNFQDSPTQRILFLLWHFLTYMHSLLNPIIYNVFSRDFRTALTEILCHEKRDAI